jgi:hypothetical protein
MMTNTTEQILQARTALWFKGNLSWKLDVNQKVLYDIYKTNPEKILVFNMARSLGKSYLLCVLAIEECLNNPKALVKFACGKQRDATQIIQPLMRDLTEDCPHEIKPVFIKGEGAYRFPNGAVIQLSGLDSGKAESLRGGSSQLCIIDEAGTKSLKKDLEYIVNSIMLPAVTRSTKIDGKIILASTPPISYDHPYITFLRRAELKNASITRTIYTNPRMTIEMIDKLAENMGGKNSPQFRREYLAEIVADEEDRVVPEFTFELQNKITKVWSRPNFFDAYVSMDIGIKDLTAVLFAYYDFNNDKIVIEDEFSLNGSKFTTQYLAEAIKEKERFLYTDIYGDFKTPYKRVADNNLILINDLNRLHDLTFLPTQKDNADAARNNMRMMLEQGKIIIHPKCTNLIRHLRDATWNKARTSYDRSADNGHYDFCDSLSYLVRNIDFYRNPYPSNYNLPTGSNSFYRNGLPQKNSSIEAVKQLLNIKKK